MWDKTGATGDTKGRTLCGVTKADGHRGATRGRNRTQPSRFYIQKMVVTAERFLCLCYNIIFTAGQGDF